MTSVQEEPRAARPGAFLLRAVPDVAKLLPRMRTSLLSLMVAGLAMAGCGVAPDTPNVVLITVDTLRPDHLGAYGYPRGTSPVVDRLCREGTLFETAIVPRGQTWPTLASILTSQYPVTHGVRKNGLRLQAGAVTIAHVLADRGYDCIAALANSGSADWPGFDRVVQQRGADLRIGQAASEWIRTGRARPFFLWVHLFAPHRPYDPPGELERRFDPGYAGTFRGSVEGVKRISERRLEMPPEDVRHLVALYDGEVRVADSVVGELLAALDAAGLTRETLVVLTADHGEELYERNRYISHSASVYDTVLRAPLLLRQPGVVPAGSRVRGIAEAVDIAPTILGMLGIRAPASFRGRSLADVVTGAAPMGPGVAFSELEDRIVTVRTPDARYVHNPTDFDFPLNADDPDAVYPIGREELYLLEADPAERVNRAGARPEEARRLRETALRWQRAHDWDAASHRFRAREMPAELRDALGALGYVP